jgi:Tol biopolymer transport system component
VPLLVRPIPAECRRWERRAFEKEFSMSTKHVWLTLATLAVGAWAVAANAQSTVHLYIYDTHTGTVTQATGPMALDPYNASFSNNGKKLVHDLTGGPLQLLGLTDLTKGTTTSLGLVGDDAVWSPNGQYIAYHNFEDHITSGFDPNVPVVLNIVPTKGGTPTTVRMWGRQASWSNNSRRLAFTDWFYGYVGTVGLDGTETRFDFDTLGSDDGYGCNPAYSPDGKLIVYERYECYFGVSGPLMAIPVDQKGQALGAPYPITSGAFYASHPSFSNDGKTIVFSANAGSDPTEWGLYTVSVYGGDPVVLFDRPGKGEWDAAYSKNGRYVVFSGPE